MKTVRLVLATIALTACGPGSQASLSVSEIDSPGSRAALSGCAAPEHGSVVVGSTLRVDAGEHAECLESDWFTGCTQYAYVSEELTVWSTDPSVAALRTADGSDRATFRSSPGARFVGGRVDVAIVGPGEATIVLEANGQRVSARAVRAEQAASLDVLLVAHPEIETREEPALAADLRPASGAAILRGGAGARIVVRPLASDGRVLCGRAPVAIAAEGLALSADEEYDAGAAELHDVLVLSATETAPTRAHVELESAGTRASLELDVIDPAALTEVRTTERAVVTEYSPGTPVIEVALFAGDVEVHGATIEIDVSPPDPWSYPSISGPSGGVFQDVRSPRDTRFRVVAISEADVPYRVFAGEAPAIGADLASRD